MAAGNEQQGVPRIDLETVRETLAYMHDDMRGVPGLARVRSALGSAIAGIDVIAATPRLAPPAHLRVLTADAPRFVPWTPEG